MFQTRTQSGFCTYFLEASLPSLRRDRSQEAPSAVAQFKSLSAQFGQKTTFDRHLRNSRDTPNCKRMRSRMLFGFPSSRISVSKRVKTWRAYANALEKQAKAEGNLSPELSEWLVWARAKADWLDPRILVCDRFSTHRSRNAPVSGGPPK